MVLIQLDKIGLLELKHNSQTCSLSYDYYILIKVLLTNLKSDEKNKNDSLAWLVIQ